MLDIWRFATPIESKTANSVYPDFEIHCFFVMKRKQAVYNFPTLRKLQKTFMFLSCMLFILV